MHVGQAEVAAGVAVGEALQPQQRSKLAGHIGFGRCGNLAKDQHETPLTNRGELVESQDGSRLEIGCGVISGPRIGHNVGMLGG